MIFTRAVNSSGTGSKSRAMTGVAGVQELQELQNGRQDRAPLKKACRRINKLK
jgi:hypothetical protein